MPVDLKQLPVSAPPTDELTPTKRDILNFLRDSPERAFTFHEISQAVGTVQGTKAILPWNPLLVGFRTFHLATALDEMDRSGLVLRERDADGTVYYHLSNGKR